MSKDAEFQRAKPLAEAALTNMLRHGVPPTPNNYMVWYAHVSGTMPELSRTIKIIVSNGQELDANRNDELFQRFFGTEEAIEALEENGGQLQEIVGKVMRQVEAAKGEASAYGEKLDAFSAEVAQTDDAERMKGLVGTLVAETRRVAERNALLQQQLTTSSGEVQQLRQNLEAVRHEALTDGLTGVANRKCFDEKLREAARESMETGEPLSLLFIDIDHFKRFNDTYGHQIGDQVLSLVARTLTDCVKGRDTTARYGGEEFAIILPQTSAENARRLAEQIRSTMERRKIVKKSSGEDFGIVTLSIGVGAFRPGEPLEALLQRADAAVYVSKRNGRNRVSSEDQVPPAAAPAA